MIRQAGSCFSVEMLHACKGFCTRPTVDQVEEVTLLEVCRIDQSAGRSALAMYNCSEGIDRLHQLQTAVAWLKRRTRFDRHIIVLFAMCSRLPSSQTYVTGHISQPDGFHCVLCAPFSWLWPSSNQNAPNMTTSADATDWKYQQIFPCSNRADRHGPTSRPVPACCVDTWFSSASCACFGL